MPFSALFQVIGLKDHEMKWLCRHLGHTRKVHEQHYRSTSGLIERLDIAKLMLLQEGNLQGKFQGKPLNDITFEGTLFHTKHGVYLPFANGEFICCYKKFTVSEIVFF